ncbi:MAG: cytochrome c biogenesis protein CcsA [Candidatus Nitrohelix vancouverensis]|uniref:Cytochrome c biogenesis protein CcsA n=1 Tax=Candidatus Nitrohelix vancouverensis TaxID=2705534 RepID=A0A7T0C3L7_9BACT|nr:MAG: cytochrome c biogenesis protein CcsA [Candidatus Nitrohelix vancouverensis]
MTKIAFNISVISYLCASVAFFIFLVYRKATLSNIANVLVGIGLVFHTLMIGLRSAETGHGPYTTSFEVAVFFSWVVVIGYSVTEWKYRIKDLGAFVIPVVFLSLFYSIFLSKDLPVQDSEAALWMTLHRALSVLGYGAFTVAFAVGVMYLIQENQVKSKKLGIMYFRMPSLEMLDTLNDKIIAIGFPLFTLGFMTGSIWNIKMDLPFFSWSAMKTWPLVLVWLVYGAVFFGRLAIGMRGKKAAQGAIFGFILVILTYLMHV